MLQLIKLLKTDIMKLKSTQIFWVHLYIPLLTLLIFLSYYSISPASTFSKIAAYLQILGMAFPAVIGIVTSMVAEQENSAGGFQNILLSSRPKYLAILSKLILFIALGTLSTSLAVGGFYLGYSFMGNNIYPGQFNLILVGILLGSNVFQYIFHFFLSFRFGKGISSGLGIAESLLAALFLTGLGDGRWPFVPSSWGIRFVSFFLLKQQNPAISFKGTNLIPIICFSCLATIIAFLSLLVWFSRWAGNKREE